MVGPSGKKSSLGSVHGNVEKELWSIFAVMTSLRASLIV